MAAYEVKRILRSIDYLDVEASNEEEAIELVKRGLGNLTAGLHLKTSYEAQLLFETPLEDWSPEDDAIVDDAVNYLSTHPFVD